MTEQAIMRLQCARCKKEIPVDKELEFSGTAHVSGITSIKKFMEEGIDWQSSDSWDEQIACPHCCHLNSLVSLSIFQKWFTK